jgi:hypothetical protein
MERVTFLMHKGVKEVPMSDRLLRSALATNAAVTGLCGVIFAAFAGTLAPHFGLDVVWPVQAVAALYLVFGAALGATALRPLNLALQTKLLIAGDLGYVAATAALLVGWPEILSGLGKAVAVVVALAVVALVTAEAVGLKRLHTV